MTDGLRDFILTEGRDDWVPLAAVRGAARERGGAPIEVICGLLDDGLVEVGDLTAGAFVPWTGDPTEVRARLQRVAEEADSDFSIWLNVVTP
jgi:hypothetical protein